MELFVSEIQRFCMHDGPGIRTVVFLKGCPLRCAWCHNPETQSEKPELLFYSKKCMGCGMCVETCSNGIHCWDEKTGHCLDRKNCMVCGECADVCPTGALSVCGRTMSVEQLVEEIEKDRAFYGANGGVTLSGGEPFLQGEGSVELLKACRDRGISTAVETCGQFHSSLIPRIVPVVDLFLWDVKDTDPERHTVYTGCGNELILSNLKKVDALGGKTRLRCIVVSGVNYNQSHLENLKKLKSELANCQGIDFLPYHAYGGEKATFLGRPNNGKTEWVPEDVPKSF